jgi:hypothetical protein
MPDDPNAMIEKLIAHRERWGLNYLTCFDRDLERLLPAVGALSAR